MYIYIYINIVSLQNNAKANVEGRRPMTVTIEGG